MYQLTDRCNTLKTSKILHTDGDEKYLLQRQVYFAIGAAEAAQKGLPPDEIFARATANVIDSFTPYIEPKEIIVGFNFGRLDVADLKNDEKSKQQMRESEISEGEIERYFSSDDNYKSYAFQVGLNLIADAEIPLTKEEREMESEWAAIGRCICSNHSVIGYEKVLKLGFEGLLKEINAYEKKNGDCSLYRATKTICKSALKMGEKYAELAENLMQNSNYNVEDLKKIISICKQVPRYPARNFIEAVQSLWFAHIINTWEDIINANSLGRLDQILYPYYKADIEKGILTKEEAFEIICLLWIKLYRDYDVQQSCVGGTNVDNSSAVNDLSYMMLDATERLDFIRCLSVRYSKYTEKQFLQRALEVVGHMQKGVPFFFNDDVMIPALMDKGIAKEDAYDYTQIGCVETVIPGKSNPHAVTGETNLLKAIEYVLCNGASMLYPDFTPGVKTGELQEFDTYKKFYDAVMKQIDHILDVTCSHVKKHANIAFLPSLINPCLHKAVWKACAILMKRVPNTIIIRLCLEACLI